MGVWQLVFDVFRYSFFVLFVGVHAALVLGVVIVWRRKRRNSGSADAERAPDPGLSVCVVVPARNEEAVLPRLLSCLRAQDYPDLSVLLIDDRSGDRTLELMAAFAASMPEGRVRVLRISENRGPNFKQRALELALRDAGEDVLLFTDADCAPPSGWARAMVRAVSGEGVGVAFAPVFKAIDGNSFLADFQAFDHAVRFAYLAGAAALGSGSGAFGNNMAIRRTALDAIGGYGAVPVSLTEDAALVAMVRERTPYRVVPALGADCSMGTEPVSSWRELAAQGLRWNNGGLFAPDLPTRLSFGTLALSISAGCLAVPLLPMVSGLWPLPAAILVAMSADAAVATALAREAVPLRGRFMPLLVLFMPLFFTYLTILGLAGKQVVWKDEEIEPARRNAGGVHGTSPIQ